MASKKKYTFIDLFAGAGGLSEGFIRAGFTPIVHIEMDKSACETLKTRTAYHYFRRKGKLEIYKKYLQEKNENGSGQTLWNKVPEQIMSSVLHRTIGEDTIEEIFQKVDELKGEKQIDVIIGGPPCQAYSIVGRARMGERVLEDPRNELYKYYVMFLERYSPQMFVFENVLGIYTAKEGGPIRDLEALVKNAGYQMEMHVQNASDFGVLQKRQRVIIVGWKMNNKKQYYYPKLKKAKNQFKVMSDLFNDLPLRKAGEGSMTEIVPYIKSLEDMPYLKSSKIRNNIFDFTTQHVARPQNLNDRKIYRLAIIEKLVNNRRLDYSKLPPNLQTHNNKKSFLDRYSVVNPNGYSHTVVAHISKDGHYYIYPTQNPTVENVRSITVREAARLQSFPDDYFFEGSRCAAFRQIGNAVPVLLAYKIALALKKQL